MSKETVLMVLALGGLLFYLAPRESDYAGQSQESVVIEGANFETEVIQSPVPVLAYFWASW